MGKNYSTMLGYRILQISENSSFKNIQIESLLDFIIIPYDKNIKLAHSNFKSYLEKHENIQIELEIYNLAENKIRKIHVVPSKNNGKSMLGVDVILEKIDNNYFGALHILNLYVNSPFDKAGICPLTDYILGTNRQIFNSITDFESYIKCFDKSIVQLVVYSSKTEKTRNVFVIPNKNWGGDGYLGGDIAIGTQHLIPKRKPKMNDESPKAANYIGNTEVIVNENIGETGTTADIKRPILNSQEQNSKKHVINTVKIEENIMI